MAIRSSSKAIILHDQCILVNRCVEPENGHIYYDLPGGGQRFCENLEQTVVREVLEETGYHIRPLRLAAVAEEIYLDEDVRREYPDYSHRVLHIFFAELIGSARKIPTEQDYQQIETIWLPLEQAYAADFYPTSLTGKLSSLISDPTPQYLGCSYIP